MTEAIASILGGRIFHEISGEGTPVVLVNPGGLDCRIWEPQWGALAARHRVLRYDPRGWGRSSRAEGPFSHLDDLRALMDFAGMERAHLIGSSFGGSLGLDFMAELPERLHSAVLVGAGGPQNGFPMPEDMARSFAPVAEALAVDVRRAIDVWLEIDERLPEDPELRAVVRENALANPTYWTIPPSWTRATEPHVSERLEDIDVPALVVTGEREHPYSVGIAETLAKRMPHARHVALAGAGHLVHLDRAEAFNRLVLDFVAEPPR